MNLIHKLLAIFARFFSLFKRKKLQIIPIKGISTERSLLNIPEIEQCMSKDAHLREWKEKQPLKTPDLLGMALKKFRQNEADISYEQIEEISLIPYDSEGNPVENFHEIVEEKRMTTKYYEQQIPTFVPVKQPDGSYAIEFNGKKVGTIEKR